MTCDENDNDEKEKGWRVEIYKLANRLKSKLGYKKNNDPGFIDPEAIEEAEKIIEDLCAECPKTIAGHLQTLSDLWKKMKDMPHGPERDDLSEQVFTVSHEIKDIGSMCGYHLVAYFAESLRDFIGKTSLSLNAQRVIVQAHLDAMQATHGQGIKDDGGPLAEELKFAVKKAIEKYG